MIARPDLLDNKSPPGIEVFQLTSEIRPSSHVYMEAQIFLPDSKRFVLHHSAHAHGSDFRDPHHKFILCDLDDKGKLYELTREKGATAPCVSPDGGYFYYFTAPEHPQTKITLKRKELDSGKTSELFVIDNKIPGTDFYPYRLYQLSTISSDGKRIAAGVFLGDGIKNNQPWGLLVFDLEKFNTEMILCGKSWANFHPQYCRSQDKEEKHDLLVQQNHGNEQDRAGRMIRLHAGKKTDIHVIRDDGTNFRTMPWGRNGMEWCQGHHCWRGQRRNAISGTSYAFSPINHLIMSFPIKDTGHKGLQTKNGKRNILDRTFSEHGFCHFATDTGGNRLISDCTFSGSPGRRIVAGSFSDDDSLPIKEWRYLLNPNSSGIKESHIHPFLSPDGRRGFFNSDESGVLQAYMICGIDETD